MSVTIEDKIELFSKVIFGNIETQSSRKREMLAESYKKKLESHAIEVEKRKKELIDAAIKKAEREKTKLIAQAKNQSQHNQVDQRQHAMHKVMEKLQELASAYTNTQDYKYFMEKNVQTVINTLDMSKQIVFYTMEKDFQLCESILKDKLGMTHIDINYQIKRAAHNIIGGLIAEDTENLLQLDLTLKAIIDDYKDTVGAAITRKFNEVSSL